MDRLTGKRVNGIKQGFWSPAKKEDLCQRLGAYEETGLTPEEIEELKRRTVIIHDAEKERPKVEVAGPRIPALLGFVKEVWLTFEDGTKKYIHCWEHVRYDAGGWWRMEDPLMQKADVRYWVELPRL